MDREALHAFAHLGVFIQLQDLSRSYMTRKFETIPYYSAKKKKKVFLYGSTFIKGNRDH